MEKSPSLVYGARLELVYGLIAHRGFESLLLRQKSNPTSLMWGYFFDLNGGFERERYCMTAGLPLLAYFQYVRFRQT